GLSTFDHGDHRVGGAQVNADHLALRHEISLSPPTFAVREYSARGPACQRFADRTMDPSRGAPRKSACPANRPFRPGAQIRKSRAGSAKPRAGSAKPRAGSASLAQRAEGERRPSDWRAKAGERRPSGVGGDPPIRRSGLTAWIRGTSVEPRRAGG